MQSTVEQRMAGPGRFAVMHGGGATATDGERRPVLFLNTPTAPPLGADTWIHAEIMRRLDRADVGADRRPRLRPGDDPTPTHRVAAPTIPDLELVRANLGPELGGRSRARQAAGARRDGAGAVDDRPSSAC